MLSRSRVRAASFVVCCVLLLVFQSKATRPDVPLHPYCSKLLQKIPKDSLHHLRDLFQVLYMHVRLKEEYSTVAEKWTLFTADEASFSKDELGWLDPMGLNQSKTIAETSKNASELAAKKIQKLLRELFLNGSLRQPISIENDAGCFLHHLNTELYPHRPTISFILQYYKRPWMIRHFIGNLSKAAKDLDSELIVNVDSFSEGQEWAQLVNETQGWVVPVFSANVHEARAYNRAARIARGKYLCFLQDDDIPSADPRWITDKLKVLDKYVKIGVIGCKSFRWCVPHERQNHFGEEPYADSFLTVNFAFVHAVDFAPMFLRRSAFMSVGGLDETLSDPGHCGIWGDWDLSMRMWTAGWQVAYMPARGFQGDGHTAGTHLGLNSQKCWGRQQHIAGLMYAYRWNHGELTNEVCETVRRLNIKYLTPVTKTCPYPSKNCAELNATELASVSVT